MYQKLLTKEVLSKLPPLYSQENNKDPIVWMKLFHPLSSWTFYATEYDPEEQVFFGWTKSGGEGELGYQSLKELEGTVIRGLHIERDMYFDPKPLSLVKAGKESAPYKLSAEEKKVGRKTGAKRLGVKRATKKSPSGFGGIR